MVKVEKGIITLQQWIKKRSSNYAKKDFIERIFDKRTIMLIYFTSGICVFVVLPSFLFRYMEGWTYLGKLIINIYFNVQRLGIFLHHYDNENWFWGLHSADGAARFRCRLHFQSAVVSQRYSK